ncbi:hypothetical protein H6F89_14185 [Cyanobacteria bacterium FACHB-63]|nr:hypothetical protein [Cyanobacteria bacterium FACHB-63]
MNLLPTIANDSTVHEIANPQQIAIEQALHDGWQIVQQIQAFALQLAELGDIDLPPAMASESDRTQLKTVASLYLASELELARILPAIDTLVGIAISGGLRTDLGAAAPLIATFWQTRHQRFTTPERQAIFTRLFGTPAGPTLAASGGRNTAFEGLMIDFAEALYKIDPVPGLTTRISSDISTRTAARRLAGNLISRSGGIAAFAAQELMRSLSQAIEILKQPAIQQAVQARSVWMALRNIAQTYLNEDVDLDSHLQRGRNGMQILSWLAEVLPHLEEENSSLVTPDHSVVLAATRWLQASLAIADASSNSGGQT